MMLDQSYGDALAEFRHFDRYDVDDGRPTHADRAPTADEEAFDEWSEWFETTLA